MTNGLNGESVKTDLRINVEKTNVIFNITAVAEDGGTGRVITHFCLSV